MRRAPAPPLWCLLCVAVVGATVLRCWLGGNGWEPPGDGDGPRLQLAFFGFIVAIAGAIWNGIQVAAKVTLAALSWSVKALWFFAQKVANGLAVLGKDVLLALRKAWGFFEWTYANVLKPAITKFWRWFDRFRRWLDTTFAPIFEFLRDVRDAVMRFYKTWIRPWLDLIDVSRRVLRILGSMGLDWARALDRRLGDIADAIDRPFRLVLAEINKVINIVNRIVTANGLLQRVALIRSLSRDVRQAWRLAVNWRQKDVTETEWEELRKRARPYTTKEIATDAARTITGGAGRHAALTSEMAATWSKILSSRDTS